MVRRLFPWAPDETKSRLSLVSAGERTTFLIERLHGIDELHGNRWYTKAMAIKEAKTPLATITWQEDES